MNDDLSKLRDDVIEAAKNWKGNGISGEHVSRLYNATRSGPLMAIAYDEPATRPHWPTTALLGPADADHYRVKVGRYGDRWYQDGDNGPYPSISTIKKASGNDWSFVALKRVAHAHNDQLADLTKLDPDARYDRVKSIDKLGLSIAAGRGTIIHWWFEDMLTTGTMRDVTPTMLRAAKIPAAALDEALHYRTAVHSFFDTYQPRLIAAECVVMHTSLNGVGYGGTADVVLELPGHGTYWCDWKSRGIDSDHGAYPEEAAQIAAAARCEYMIVSRDGGVDRIPPVPADGGLVVSTKHTGVRLYPVELDPAFTHFTALHAWWVARRSEREPIGRPWQPKTAPVAAALEAGDGESTPAPAGNPGAGVAQPQPEGETCSPLSTSHLADSSRRSSTSETLRVTTRRTSSTTSTTSPTSPDGSSRASVDSTPSLTPPSSPSSKATTRQALRDRVRLLNDEQRARFQAHGFDKDTPTETIAAALDAIDPFATVAPLTEPTPEPDVVEHEGFVSQKERDDLMAMVSASPVKDIVNQWMRDGKADERPWNVIIQPTPTNVVRTKAALKLAMAFSNATATDAECPAVVAALNEATGDDWGNGPIGESIGTLTADEAVRVVELAQDVIDGRLGVTYDDDGTVRLVPVEGAAA